jgi:hypothetical protein
VFFNVFPTFLPDNMDPERSQLKDSVELMVLKSIGLGYKRFDLRVLSVTLRLSGRTGRQGQKGYVGGNLPEYTVFGAMFRVALTLNDIMGV